MTHWYEIYYDVWLGGQYFKKIQEMHERYGKLTRPNVQRHIEADDLGNTGPIVRINPDEVHFNDPEFIDSVLPGPPRKTDKSIATGRRTGSKAPLQLKTFTETHKSSYIDS